MKHALLRTLPGRAIVASVAVKALIFVYGLVAALPAFLRVIDTLASVVVAIGGAYFLVRGLAFAQRRLLWRVRRKLMISYIFIGFIPSLLIVAFFLLGGLFLFSNFSSYLVQNRVASIAEQLSTIATATAMEIQSAGGSNRGAILPRRESGLEREFPGISFALVPMPRGCGGSPPRPANQPREIPRVTAGPWAHVPPPDSLPPWLTPCKPFA